MILFAAAVLLLWLPIVLSIFASRPPKQAVVTSFIGAWLFLPNIGFNLPGLPDYTKMSATTMGVMLSIAIFDAGRFWSIRPRLYDLPMVVWCVCPFFSSVAVGLGPYEGFSAVLSHLFSFGMPYLIGRLYLNDFGAIRLFALGMVVGGLAYLPLCLIEMRLSPILGNLIYGIYSYEGTRNGGYRPRVFLSTGLETGIWMANASLIVFWLRSSGSVKTIRGYPIGVLTLALLVVSLLCRAAGAMSLMLVGMACLVLVRSTKKTWPVWILIALPPVYEVSRTSGAWSGKEAVEISSAVFGGERAQSLEYRVMMEEVMIKRATQRTLLGWGRFGGFLEVDKSGRQTFVPDGYWIIALGTFGIVGLASMTTMWLLPLVLLIRRQPATTWSQPEVGAAAVLSVVLALYMVDNLSNAMPNPIYALAMGGLVALPSGRLRTARSRAESSLAAAADLVGEGRTAEAEAEFRRAIGHASGETSPEGSSLLAEALGGLGHVLMTTGQPDEAEAAFRDALAVREAIAAGSRDAADLAELAVAREALGRALAETGRAARAIEHRQAALEIWDELATSHPGDPEILGHRVDARNDLAWVLATDPDPAIRDPARALGLAEEAVRDSTDPSACWNTLGVARYRSGDFPGAVEALERSAASSPGEGGTAFDHYILAMACLRLGEPDRARDWFDQAVAWTDRHRPGHPTLARFHEEAVALFGKSARPGSEIIPFTG